MSSAPHRFPPRRRRLRAMLAGGLLAVATQGAVGAPTSLAAQTAAGGAARPLAFGIGESMVYDVKYGMFNVGTARMEVVGLDTLRGRRVWHTKLEISGGIPGYRVHDVLESWIDVETFNSLRHRQETVEGKRERTKVYEIYPERGVFREDAKPERPTVANPLDDGSFLYFIRTIPLEVGKTYEFSRYFRPDRNPVIVRVLGRETITVPAGTFHTLVIQPIIKSKGVFSKNGRAEIWFTDDERRLMVRMETHVVFGTISLQLREFSQGATP